MMTILIMTPDTLLSTGLNAGLNSNYYSTGTAVTMECSLGVGSDGAVPSSTAWYAIYLIIFSTC